MKKISVAQRIHWLNCSVRTKIVFVFILLFFFSTLALVIEGYYFSQKTVYKRTMQYMQSMVGITTEELNRVITQINDTSRSVIANEHLQEQLSRLNSLLPNTQDALACKSELQNTLETYALLRTEIISIYLKSDSGIDVHYNKSHSFFAPDYISSHEQSCKELDGRPLWVLSNPADGVISCIRHINYTYTHFSMGYVAVNLQESCLSELYANNLDRTQGNAFILTSDNQIVSSNDTSLLGETLPASVGDCRIGDIDIIQYNNQKCIVYTGNALCNGWRFALVIPYLYHLDGLLTLKSTYVFSFFIVLIFGMGFLTFFLQKLISPLSDLDIAITRFGEGHFETRCSVSTSDEFGHLSEMFNTMAGNIVQLHDTVFAQEIQLRDAKLNALQMQISPHFLYNTLDTINWLAQLNGMDDISNIAFSLAALMRYALKNESTVTVSQEISNVRSYIQIQSYRYEERLRIHYDLEQDLLQMQIPKLILQPIVENSIIHGIERKPGNGNITIRLFRFNDRAFAFEVTDDGVGIPADKVHSLLVRVHTELHSLGSTESIGLVNVGKRVCAVSGCIDAFQISSTEGIGTTIRMVFPLEE